MVYGWVVYVCVLGDFGKCYLVYVVIDDVVCCCLQDMIIGICVVIIY